MEAGLRTKISGRLSTAPPHALVVRPFAKLMASHDPDAVQRLVDARDFQALPSHEVRHEPWRLRGTLVPKSPAKRGDGSTRAIGIGPEKVGRADNSTPVKRALVKKARKYGEPDAPYVVAINAHDIDDAIRTPERRLRPNVWLPSRALEWANLYDGLII